MFEARTDSKSRCTANAVGDNPNSDAVGECSQDQTKQQAIERVANFLRTHDAEYCLDFADELERPTLRGVYVSFPLPEIGGQD